MKESAYFLFDMLHTISMGKKFWKLSSVKNPIVNGNEVFHKLAWESNRWFIKD